MARCEGTTLEGRRCKREAPEGERYCSQHADQADGADRGSARARGGAPVWEAWDRDDCLKAALGVGLLGLLLFLRLRR